ncbi:putative aflatoxin cluster transcription [Rosellinia necatrix]|uniref:Putative aflatoxin cluster transcription n=1 Tax=Rosellinia necatrix TaxID=77044 RepID=A0A1W2TDB9_ROSNE|nr:putative aflatoxin cluster transcription [Rosellinia necatrix]
MTGRQTTRTRQKYKDSCTHCAGAKVRCSKEKPRCTRCNERGLECSYGLSYRYGRLPARAKMGAAGFIDQAITTAPSTPRELLPNGSRTPSPTSEPTAMPISWLSESNMDMLNANTAAISGFSSLGYGAHAPNNFLGHPYDAAPAPLAPVSGHTQTFQTLTPTSDPAVTSAAATFNTLSYIPCLDTLGQSVTRRHHSRSVSSASSIPSGYDYSNGAYPNTSPVAFGTPPETPRARPVQNYAVNMPHDCLSQAAATLLSLRRQPISGQARNRDMMEYIIQMIECDCFTQDGHMRMFMVLIGFEVMEGYSKTTQDEMAMSSTEGILGDLHVVLKLVERLLRRLRETGHGNYAQGLTPGSPTGQTGGSAISFAVFGQLEADLRKYLRGISHNPVDVFRRV